MSQIDLGVLQRLFPHPETRGLVAAGLLDKASQLGVDLLLAGLIGVATFWASGWASGLVRRAFDRLSDRHHPPDPTIASFFSSLVRYLVIVVGLVAMLQQLGIKTASILAVLGAASLAIGLALQGALGNMAAGIMILLFRPYRVGDVIESGTRKGTVRNLDLFFTELATDGNLKVLIPNGKVFGDVIVNHTGFGHIRADLVFKAPATADIPVLIEALTAWMAEDGRIDETPSPTVEVSNMDKDNIELTAKLWTTRADKATVTADTLLAARQLSVGQADQAPKPAPRRPKAATKPDRSFKAGATKA
jgi:small conductance mechanosensitive channel